MIRAMLSLGTSSYTLTLVNLQQQLENRVEWIFVRCSSHQGGSPQNGLRDERTCGMALASAYVLHCLSAM